MGSLHGIANLNTHVFIGAIQTFTSTPAASTGTEMKGVTKLTGFNEAFEKAVYHPLNNNGYPVVTQTKRTFDDVSLDLVRLVGDTVTYEFFKDWQASGPNTAKSLVVMRPLDPDTGTFTATEYTVIMGNWNSGDIDPSIGFEYNVKLVRSDSPAYLVVTGTEASPLFALEA